jgi:hypothetical protein
MGQRVNKNSKLNYKIGVKKLIKVIFIRPEANRSNYEQATKWAELVNVAKF